MFDIPFHIYFFTKERPLNHQIKELSHSFTNWTKDVTIDKLLD